MARHAEVCQQPVDLFHTIIAHPVLQITEITSYKSETLVVDDVLLRIFVLVKAVQMALLTQSAEDLTTVAATAEGHVYINATGLDLKPVDALPKEHWYVITFRLDHLLILKSQLLPRS